MPQPSDHGLPTYRKIQELLALSQAHLREARQMQADGLFDLAEDKALEAAAQASQALIATARLFRAPHEAARAQLEGRLMRIAGDLPSMDTRPKGLPIAWRSGGSPRKTDDTGESDDLVERAETLVDSISRLLRGVLPLIWYSGGVWPSEGGVGSA